MEAEAHAKHAEGRRKRIVWGATREAWVSAAQQDGGGSTDEGSARFLLWTTNNNNDNGAADPCTVCNREEGHACLETIDQRA